MLLNVMIYSDCPSTVTVSPSSGPFKVGDVLTCTSDGFPEPSYTWTDGNGVVVSILVLTSLSLELTSKSPVQQPATSPRRVMLQKPSASCARQHQV